jgi:hypothetical protein
MAIVQFAVPFKTISIIVENAFEEMYGLSVQVFRKSGNTWLQTTTSDSWTLNEQNQKALEKHEVIKEDSVDAMDLQDLE